MQVDNLGLLATPFGQGLRAITLTLVEIKFARKSKQLFQCLTIQPKSTQVE